MRLQDVRVFAAIASASDEKVLGSQAQAEWGSAPKQKYDYGRFFWLSWDVRGCLVVIFAVGGAVFGLIVPALLGCGLRLLTALGFEVFRSALVGRVTFFAMRQRK
jgi:hypothetical protein